MNTKRTILIFEDDDLDAEFINRALKKSTTERDVLYELDRVVNFSSGLLALEENEYDLILLDLGLPDTTREHSLKELLSLYPETPVIVLTGLNDREVSLQSLRDGAQDYLVKGQSSPNELIRCITYAIERHRTKRELETTANQLARKSAIFQSVINHMGDGVIVTDETGKLALFNPAAIQLLDACWMDIPPEEWPTLFDALMQGNYPDDAVEGHSLAGALQGEEINGEEIRVQTVSNPEGKYVSVTARSICDQQNVIQGCVAVLHDITKRHKVEVMKDEFISTVSHELRTPLTSISGSLGLVLGGIVGEISAEASEMVGIAQRNSDRLVRLINDLLDVQKLEAGKMEMKLKPLNISDFLIRALEVNAGYAAKHDVSFRLENDLTKQATIKGDEDRLMQVMANLLSNAAKYSPQAGEVVVRVVASTDKIEVSVKDQGSGIPEEFHTDIFGKFTQADSSTTRKKEGTGLGLNICKSIVNLHGGEIGFDTELDRGTTFYFTLPVAQLFQGREASEGKLEVPPVSV